MGRLRQLRFFYCHMKSIRRVTVQMFSETFLLIKLMKAALMHIRFFFVYIILIAVIRNVFKGTSVLVINFQIVWKSVAIIEINSQVFSTFMHDKIDKAYTRMQEYIVHIERIHYASRGQIQSVSVLNNYSEYVTVAKPATHSTQ